MDLNELAIFARVAEARSFTAAAERLGVPKSTVSRAVSRLEDGLGVKLLQRTTRALALTAAGEALYQRVAPPLKLLREAAEQVVEHLGQVCGTLRVTAPNDLGTGVLAELVARFTALYPQVHVEAELTNRLVDLVAEGFDLALRAGKLRDSTLVVRKLGESTAGIYAAPAYLARRGIPREVAELAEHECVLFRAKDGRNEWVLQGPAGEERAQVSGRSSGDDFSFVRGVARAGAGLALIPGFLCAQDVAEGRLVRVLPGHAFRGSTLHIVYPPTRHLPARVAAFRDFLIANLGPQSWLDSEAAEAGAGA